ncbi:iron complex transport system permease protein [Aminobacter lissarensis]|uniref:Iron complex transport system permease protein n=1 Tax=Aminobacter carboxidus TaxID=376165 RepID=A0A8E1WCT2_9HYPH|nr:iron ABC transporter permease [Aminobacter lissarensis]MBB6465888.1 iron complex transport system permease protein [Aminobacter lissarensis]
MSSPAPRLSPALARINRRAWVAVGIIAAVAVVLALCGVGFGSTWIDPRRVVEILMGEGARGERVVVLQLRAPRVAIAALAGGAMAVAGYLLQKVTRNELASPGVLGVIGGAGLGVVIFLALLSDESNSLVTSIVWQPVAAMIGASLAIAAVFLLSGQQASSAVRLLLFGIAVGAVCKAATLILMIVGPIYRTTQASRWLAGAVNEINWGEVQVVATGLAIAMVGVVAVARRLPPTDLDEVSARGLGLNLPVFRILVFALASALTALAVAFAGGVGFIGLMAPHLARLIVGRPVLAGIAASFLLGAIMLIGADLIVRVLFAPTEVPAGTVTAVIGTPYFLYLVLRRGSTNG